MNNKLLELTPCLQCGNSSLTLPITMTLSSTCVCRDCGSAESVHNVRIRAAKNASAALAVKARQKKYRRNKASED